MHTVLLSAAPSDHGEVWLMIIPAALILMIAGGRYINNRFLIPFINDRVKPLIRKFWSKLHFHNIDHTLQS